MSVHSLREDALQFYRQGLAAADPYAVVNTYLATHQTELQLNIKPADAAPIHLIAIGKAACPMLEAALAQIPASRLAQAAFAVTHDDNFPTIHGAEIRVAGHPLPDQRGLAATHELVARLKLCQPHHLVVLLLSGGGSALVPSPARGISLTDKIRVTELLLACGADIQHINCVRKHCSQLKGGGLARMINGATLHTLALSDVIDDDPGSIASGPGVADNTRFSDAITILHERELWNQIPDSVRQHLLAGQAGQIMETLKVDDALNANLHFSILASNRHSVWGMEQAVRASRYQLLSSQYGLKGEAANLGRSLAEQTRLLLDSHPTVPLARLGGGETTVTLGPDSGSGGRNQELALAFAVHAESLALPGYWCLLSAGSDGRDGPTPAAGAVVDQDSLRRMRQAGIDPLLQLRKHNSHPALLASQDLIMTGATGTNVADLQILLWEPTI